MIICELETLNRNATRVFGFALSLLILMFYWAQSAHSQGMAPNIEFTPKHYVCQKISKPLTIDGRFNETAWQQAPWTDDFVDILGDSVPKPRFKTNVKMLWDNAYLYIAAKLQEPHLWATLEERDAVIFHDNNFEVFVDPDGDTHHYYELEVNALGTYWDLMLTKPYRDGGKAIDSWDMRELGIGIGVNGTLNNPADIDSGWTIELAIPWKDLKEASADGEKPSVGDQLRINFSRVEWQLEAKDGSYAKQRNKAREPVTEDNWVWSPQGVVNMHYPEMWGYVQFAGEVQQAQPPEFTWKDSEYIKWYLRRLYYRQHDYKKEHGIFATNPEALRAGPAFKAMNLARIFPDLSFPKFHATAETFEIGMQNKAADTMWIIRENGHVWNTRITGDY